MKLDLEQARAFLDILAPDEQVTFQIFSDREELKLFRNGRRCDPAAHILHGSLEDHATALSRLNTRYAGIHVMISAGDARGRTRKHVTRVRAAFVDLDGAPLPKAWGLEPHLLVESSSGRFHAYWLVHDVPMHEFTPVQKALATHYGSDPSVCDLPRVMRLPGFYHCKREPVMSKLLKAGFHPAYARAALLAAWPTVAAALRPKLEKRPRPPSFNPQAASIAERILASTLQRYGSVGLRHEGAKQLACQALWNGLTRDEAERLAAEYAAGVEGSFSLGEAQALVDWAYTNQPPGEPWETAGPSTKTFRGRVFQRMRSWGHGRT